MKYVYQLQATGTDGLTESRLRTVTSTTVFTTREFAESRLAKMQALVITRHKLKEPIEVKIVPLEVVE